MNHRLSRGVPLSVYVDGERVPAFEGETVAAVLLAAGRRVFRVTPHRHESRGLYCGIGICHDCLVTIDGCPGQRACLMAVRAEMRIETQAARSQAAR